MVGFGELFLPLRFGQYRLDHAGVEVDDRNLDQVYRGDLDVFTGG